MKPFLSLTFIAVLAAAAHAADPALPVVWPRDGTVDPTTWISRIPTGETTRLVQQLGAADFNVREAAIKELIDKGVDAFPGLFQALDTAHDVEATARVERLYGSWHGEPIVLPEVVSLLQRYADHRADLLTNARTNAVADPIMVFVFQEESGPGDAHDQFFRAALSQEKDPQLVALLKDRQKQTLGGASFDILDGHFDAAQHVLGIMAEVSGPALDNYVVLCGLRQGAAFDPEEALVATGLQKGTRDFNELALKLYRAKGNLARAVQIAMLSRADPGTPLPHLLVETRDYRNLATCGDSDSFMSAWGQYFCNDRQAIRAIIRDATAGTKPAGGPRDSDWTPGGFPPPPGARDGDAMLLFEMGAPDDAIKVGLTASDQIAAISIQWLCYQLRIREALAAIDRQRSVPLDAIDTLFELGLPRAARAGLGQPGSPAAQSTNRLAYAAELDRAGANGEAAKIRENVFTQMAQNDAAMKTVKERENVARALLLRAQRDGDSAAADAARLAINAAIADSFKIPSGPSISFNYDAPLPDPMLRRRADTWIDALRGSSLTPEARYDLATRASKGEISAADASLLIKAFAESNIYLPGYFEIAAGNFHAMHHDDWAAELAAEWSAHGGNFDCFITLGDFALERGQPEAAFLFYLRAARANPLDASIMYRMGIALSRGHAAPDAGRQLIVFAPYLALADIWQHREIAAVMRRFESAAAADKWFDEFSARFDTGDGEDAANRYAHARDIAFSKGDCAEAIACQQQMLADSFYSFFDPSDWTKGMSNLALYHRLRALDALTRKDFPSLADALNHELDNGPPDLDTLERTLGALRTSEPDAAQKIYTRAHDRLQPVVEDYPDATQYRDQITRLEKLPHNP